VPIGQLARRKAEFDPSRDMIVICKIGVRSVTAIEVLRDAGYKGRMFNLIDGITGWANTVDKTMATY
jgi:adenylyltransferase/sulfurtransferase